MTPEEEPALHARALVQRHLRIGWWSLLLFLSLGLALETMQGFKIGWYLDVSNHTRRLMFTLAHAHGTILSLVHLAFAATLWITGVAAARLATASTCLTLATICLPGGFFLGGLIFWGGDPGLGILLVPVGGVLLLASVLSTARALRSADAPSSTSLPGDSPASSRP